MQKTFHPQRKLAGGNTGIYTKRQFAAADRRVWADVFKEKKAVVKKDKKK